ncbi:DUF4157 domain-containing protein [Asticcacaulis sp.]|uniref:eCIS core domain-containing protein n=1 Tax=Asticcacaulis sp. TaxID=1872648 RepID=UPI002624F6B5|nr:DUF4157 domain-containing protein [Asticcacaulis sp.]
MIIYDQPQPSSKAIRTEKAVQRKSLADHRPGNTLATLADNRTGTAPRQANRTGLPDGLKRGIEHLSGISLDQVRVHYNSARPAQLHAYAYAQGTDIHLAPGQEAHLPHEAWHVVQQAQGRVRPTVQLKAGISVNDDQSLEHEADVMGAKALQMTSAGCFGVVSGTVGSGGVAQFRSAVVQMASPLVTDRLNVVGEDHSESGGRRDDERKYSEKYSQSKSYWTESQFQPTSALEQKNQKIIRGDCPFHRYIHRLSFVHQYLSEINNFYTEMENQQHYIDKGAKRSPLGQVGRQELGHEEDYSEIMTREYSDEGIDIDEVKLYEQTNETVKRAVFKKSIEGKITKIYSNILSNIDRCMGDINHLFNNIGVQEYFNEEDIEINKNMLLELKEVNQEIFNKYFDATSDSSSILFIDFLIDKRCFINNKITEIELTINKSGEYSEENKKTGEKHYSILISKSRSDQMHIAENIGFEMHGTWKIGDSHVDEMRGKRPRYYNLVSMADFNKSFNDDDAGCCAAM